MRISHLVIGLAATAAVSSVVSAQAVDSTPYLTARQLVANGDAVHGRRMVDSLLKTTMPGSAQYAEGLYWRATLAQNARDSERDYRMIVVDYPLSSRVPDALLRMGQLEAQRGDRDAALQHFQRLVIEQPQSPLRAEANYWIAKTYLERNDTQHGCPANAAALSQVSPSNVELKNRIDFQQQACRGFVASATPAPTAPTPSAPTTREVPVKSAPAAAVTKGETKPTTKVAAKPPAESVAVEEPKSAPRAADTATAASVSVKTESVKTATAAKATKATKATTTEKAVTTTPATTETAPSSGKFAVQVAAYYDRANAEALATKLKARGYAARVDGTSAPFRVRIGSYSTRAAAVAELNKLKAKKIDGFIAEM
jgi:cell division protein FtsN